MTATVMNEGRASRRIAVRAAAILLAYCVVGAACLSSPSSDAQESLLKSVRIVSPDQQPVRILSQAREGTEIVDIAFEGSIFEVVGEQGEFFEINLPGSKSSGFVQKKFTAPWAPIPPPPFPRAIIGIIIGLVVVGTIVIGLISWSRAKSTKAAVERLAEIPASIRRAEELFRSGEHEQARSEFETYLRLQGGEVRNPDVYRRLAVCYQKTGKIREAAFAWEKMRTLGGLRTVEDSALGVELKIALGQEEQAAAIYEQLLPQVSDVEMQYDIHRKLLDSYRRLEQPDKMVAHAVWLLSSGKAEKTVLEDTVSVVMTLHRPDLVVDTNHKELIAAVRRELLEQKAMTPQAEKVYLKCLELKPTDKNVHQMLSDLYLARGDYRKAISHLVMLHQLEQGKVETYIEQAARIYVENKLVQDAVAEGNPLIVKKIAQLYLAHSEVNPDAIAVYEKVLEFQPKAVGVNKMLATVYMTKGNLPKYMSKLRLLHELDGQNQDYLTELAKCIIDNDLIDESIREGSRELNSKILKQLIKKGAYDDKSVSLFEKLLKYEPHNVLIRGALVRAYEARGEMELCLQHILEMAGYKPGDEELAEKGATLAMERNLLGPVIRSATGKVLELTALKLVAKRSTDPETIEVLKKAIKEKPQQAAIRNYLSTLKPSAVKRTGEAGPEAKLVSSGSIQPQTSESADSVRDVEKQQRPMDKVAPPERSKEKSKETDSPSPEPTRRVAAKPTPKPAAQPAKEPPRQVQSVEVTTPPTSGARAVTTFVSGFARKSDTKYSEAELFLPTAGGFAYKELEVLSTDGWGKFHAGLEINTGRTVMMRILSPELMEPHAFKEFIREVTELTQNITHGSVLPMEEAVTGPASAQAMVHPLLLRTLEQIYKAKKRLAIDRVVGVALRILEGLGYVHNYQGRDGKLRRTFHLHLQPNQIFLNDDLSECRIASLGFSQIYRNITRASRPRIQEPGMNPAAVPPELFMARARVRERSVDVYAFGVLLHYMLTGKYPFEGPSVEDFKFQHTRLTAAPVRAINANVPAWLEAIIVKCLEKDPESRWDTIGAIHMEFRRSMDQPT